jgi:hypothetical protein
MVLTNKIKTISKIAAILGTESNPVVKIVYSHLQGTFHLEVSGIDSAGLVNLDEGLDNFIIALKASLQKKIEVSDQRHRKMVEEAADIFNLGTKAD